MTSKRRKDKSTKKKKGSRQNKSARRWHLSEPIAIALILIFATVLYVIIFDSKIDLNGDNTSYYLLAKGLSAFEGYAYSFTLEKSPHSHFPPGYPLIIAPFMWLSKSISFIKVINGILYGVTLWSIFRILQTIREKATAENTLITALIGMNFYFLKYSTIMMSEIPLVAISGLALVAFMKMKNDKDSWMPSKNNIFLSALIALAFLIKTLALPLLLGIIGYYLYKKSHKQAGITFLLFVLFILPYQIRNKIHGLENTYLKQLMEVNPYRPELGNLTFSTFLDRIAFNFDRYLSKEIPSGIFPIQEMGPTLEATLMHYSLGIFAVVVMLLGMLRLKDYKFFIFIYIGASFGIFLMWPEAWFGVRFMFGVMPIMLILFYHGIMEIGRFISGNMNLSRNWVGIVCLFVFGIANTGLLDENNLQKNTIKRLKAYSEQPYPKAYSNYFELAEWTKQNLPKDALVSCRKAAIFALFSGGMSNRYPYAEDESEFFDSLKRGKSKYLIVDQLGYSSTARYVLPRVKGNPEKFRLLKQTDEPKTYLLEVLD
jgi:hypothetical protein